MTQNIPSERAQRKSIFWLVFISLFIAGLHIIWQEVRLTVQTGELIKELKNRSLNYALQLQKGDKIKELFPIIAATGNLMEAHFFALQNTLQITVKNVKPRLCQKIIRSEYSEPVEIMVENKKINRTLDNCPTNKPVEMAFRYTIYGKELPPLSPEPIVQTATVFENAATLATKTAPQSETIKEKTKKSAQSIKQKTPLHRLARYRVGETLGNVISAQNKNKNPSGVHHYAKAQSAIVPHIVQVSPYESQNRIATTTPHLSTDIDTILAQDVAERVLSSIQKESVSLALGAYQQQNTQNQTLQFKMPVLAQREPRQSRTHQYQRPMSDDTHLTRTGVQLIQ